MPRTRRYQPIPDDIRKSRELAWCSYGAQVLYFRLLSVVDDDGRFDGDPELIIGTLYPFDRHVTVGQILQWMIELSNQLILIRYTSEEEYFIKLVHYVSSAKKGKPSVRFPDPPEGWRGQLKKLKPQGEPESLFKSHSELNGLNGTNAPQREIGSSCTADQNGPNGTNGNQSGAFVSLPITLLPSTYLPDPDTVPVAPRNPGTNDTRCATGSGSGSILEGDLQEKNPASDSLHAARSLWNDVLVAASRGLQKEKVVDAFARAVLTALKPGTSKPADLNDLKRLGYHLIQHQAGDLRACKDDMAWCFEEAIKLVRTGREYGQWRINVAKKFKDWSIKAEAQ